MNSRKVGALVATVLIVLVMFAPGVRGVEFRSGDLITLEEGNQTDGSLFVAGRSVILNGRVRGDLFCLGQTIDITGTVTGDVICAGQSITIEGRVEGDVRAAGQNLYLKQGIQRNFTAAAQYINMMPGGSVLGEMVFASNVLDLHGEVGQEVFGTAQRVTLGGTVGGNVRLSVEELRLEDPARVEGNLLYRSRTPVSIPPERVGGRVIERPLPSPEPETRPSLLIQFVYWIADRIYFVVAYFLVGLAGVLMWPDFVDRSVEAMGQKLASSFGWGLVMLVLPPVLILVLSLTFAGIPLALLVALLWGGLLLVSRIFVAVLIGRGLLARSGSDRRRSLLWSLGVGVVLAWGVFGLPYVGWLASLIAILWGLGGVFLVLHPNRE